MEDSECASRLALPRCPRHVGAPICHYPDDAERAQWGSCRSAVDVMCPSARVPAVFPASVWCRPTAACIALQVRFACVPVCVLVFVKMGGCRFSCVCLSLHRWLHLLFG